MAEKSKTEGKPTENGEASLAILNESLKCPVCLSPPKKPPYWSCLLGHTHCNDCHPQLKSCPVCRNRNINIHVRPIEEYLTKQIEAGKLFECQNEDAGCTTKMVLDEISEHELACHYRPVKCPGAGWNKCTWEGPFKNLVQHVMDKDCATVYNMGDTMRVRHTFPILPVAPESVGPLHYASWKPLCYLVEGEILVYVLLRRDAHKEWYLTCHTYAKDRPSGFLRYKMTVQSTPMPVKMPCGGGLPDHLAPENNRPTIEQNHMTGLKINCPRPSVVTLVVSGDKDKVPMHTNFPTHQGFCFVTVGSKPIPDPNVPHEGEDSISNAGKTLPPNISLQEVRDKGKFIALKDGQLNALRRGAAQFYFCLELGLVLSQRFVVPQLPLKRKIEDEKEDNPPEKKGKVTEKNPAGKKDPRTKDQTENSSPPGRAVSIPPEGIVVSRIVIPWKSSVPVLKTPSAAEPKEEETSKDPTPGTSASTSATPEASTNAQASEEIQFKKPEETHTWSSPPLVSYLPIYPAMQLPKTSIFEALSSSHNAIHGNQ